MAVQVNDPAGFPHHPKADEAANLIEIQPIPLPPPELIREILLNGAAWLVVLHFPSEEVHWAKNVELAKGSKVNGRQGKRLRVRVLQIGSALLY